MAPPSSGKKKTKASAGGVKGLLLKSWKVGKGFVEVAKAHFEWALRKGGRVAWMLATAGVLLLVPILFEVQRERQVIDTEKLMVEDLRKQGYPDQDIARMGYSSAVEPAVGLGEVGK